MPTIGRIDVELRGRTRQFENAMRRSSQRVNAFKGQLGRLKGGVAGLVSGAAFGQLIRSTIAETERMGQLSTRLGVGIDQFSRLARIMGRAGIGLDQSANLLQRLQRRAEEAKDGNQALGDIFSELGINVDSFLKLNAVEGFLRFSDALAGVTDASRKLFLAVKVLDVEGGQVLQLRLGQLREEMKATTGITESQKKAVLGLKESWAQLGESIKSGTLEAAESVDAFGKVRAAMDGVRSFVDQVRQRGIGTAVAEQIRSAYVQSAEMVARALGYSPDNPPGGGGAVQAQAPRTGLIGGGSQVVIANQQSMESILSKIERNTRMRGAIAQ